ncbi:Endosulfine-domain-containing protein [Aspergillus uvarum CBS 121591]|uniref:mRNA stability protein n=4 Tax=Aspergillus TaxID=5052 RepID=A0A319C6Y4_9EURO|nr:Endosulfine-domain-containing protein [Aspergillus uvarum CBS 121591]XP_025529732.1 Endosulfine-domain-containing protein [Aspergillus japonicus CBS 114.51]PYI19114.1 Endosulfine-domain-containing protein [Aspergillus violaceofuscus CBS 115571]PYI26291.1 Endosulfine-domain-containing protein [Aspergillus indologenus CBS 114.80]PYH79667.1 Endosulfine-domain-containing protein [Aspergillus uvarum CBS 121591]RAH83838.1 Endosulfine-domain-containing protein [Aspergillus japonicus CBS 114.51]
MNPHQQNKIDTSSLSPDEQRLLRLYGKMPNKKDLLQNKLKERKYFDSGDYALSKAGKASDVGVTNIGSQHPVPENIPHLTATSPGANNPGAAGNGGSISAQGGQQVPGSISGHPGSIGFQSRSPVKEASFLQRGTSVDEADGNNLDAVASQDPTDAGSVSPPPARGGVPIRQ